VDYSRPDEIGGDAFALGDEPLAPVEVVLVDRLVRDVERFARLAPERLERRPSVDVGGLGAVAERLDELGEDYLGLLLVLLDHRDEAT
jgi:hypothetical protein